ncbi:MAG: NAD(P)H-hydrate dehydratase [Deltaproteobacteria bacterium]|nr:MAG: NAD(P)H-hydrate dehydratase [Deltaproteobacteria bacterium]
MYIASSQQVREADRLTIHQYHIPSSELMERAGRGAAQIVMERFPDRMTSFLVLAGQGNNGGDGRVVARYLQEAGYKVAINLPLKDWKVKKSVIVDALFGIGLSRPIVDPQASLIRDVNSSKHFVVSLDIPSGLHADTGEVCGVCVRADLTITFGAVKWGLLKESAHEWVGELVSVDICYPVDVCEALKFQDIWVDRDFVQSWVTPRKRSSHKGSYGHLLALGGSAKKPGSIMLSGYAALRSGSGLVTVALPEIAFRKFPKDFLELMFEPLPSQKNGEFGKVTKNNLLKKIERKTALAIGPGMGTSKGSHDFLKMVIENSNLPMVIDADGLNLLANDPKLLKKLSGRSVILTPHPGEIGRLSNSPQPPLKLRGGEDRFEHARAFAQKHQIYLLLKGYRTVMATPRGKLYVNSTGNPAMATAGMGDTLTGIIGSLLAQGYDVEKRWSWDAGFMGLLEILWPSVLGIGG